MLYILHFIFGDLYSVLRLILNRVVFLMVGVFWILTYTVSIAGEDFFLMFSRLPRGVFAV